MRRLFRNISYPSIPEPLPLAYPQCSDAELVEKVSLVVTVKDTCGQAEQHLTHLAAIFPKAMPVHYAYPTIRGCRHVPVEAIGKRLFANFTVTTVGPGDSPISGFLKVQPLLATKYAILMHNDAYPMERDFACELYHALEAHPEYPIAAPQIYEKGDSSIFVPHGHHQNLHTRPTADGRAHRIDYDLSMGLLTQRTEGDFVEGPQIDFLEDHAFFARTSDYHELLDEGGSFTMEYMDMTLNMRARNTSAWFVPTARCLFDVSLSKLTWEDLPYFVYKRSEQIGHQVRNYLTNKWDVDFPNSGIWTYVRYVFLADIVMAKEEMPTDWKDQASIFFSWFESLGFNRYNGQMLPQFIEQPVGEIVNVSRSLDLELPTQVPSHRVPPKNALAILPKQQRKGGVLPEVSLQESHIPIALMTRPCTASEPSSYLTCGLAVQDGETCTCWTYVTGYNLRTTFFIDKLMDILKLPSRAFMFAQMKYLSTSIKKDGVDFFCSSEKADCSLQVQFSSSAQILQWSWFGQQSKYPVSSEGFLVFSFVALLISLFVLGKEYILSSKHISRISENQRLRGFWAVNAAVCNQATRS